MIYEMEGCRAYRNDDWKIVLRRFPTGPSELYDMKNDPLERFNLYGQAGLEEIQAAMEKTLEDRFNAAADPQYDLWKGGRSKAKRHVPDVAGVPAAGR
jgi:arylsulfatase A-like enzyme